jgi:hypothetical protein
MVALVGASAMVIDLGIFCVIQRQMQNAADSAALAAVWYGPVCDPAAQGAGGCQSTWPGPHPSVCTTTPPTPARLDEVPCSVAMAYAQQNLDLVSGLCSGPYGNAAPPTVTTYPADPYRLMNGGAVAHIYIVTIECNAPYWFGHILPTLPLSHRIATNAAAIIGWRGPNGDLASTPSTTLIARLFRTP